MEIWDGYYKDGTLANVDLVRDEPVPRGLYHLVCEVLVRHTDGDFLLMQRDFNKHSRTQKKAPLRVLFYSAFFYSVYLNIILLLNIQLCRERQYCPRRLLLQSDTVCPCSHQPQNSLLY